MLMMLIVAGQALSECEGRSVNIVDGPVSLEQAGQASRAGGRIPAVAVLVVAYNAREDLRACLESILASVDMRLRPRIVVVDNASSDGSAEMVAEFFPAVELTRSQENLGFAGGNNLGWRHLLQSGPASDYVYLLNQDTLVTDGWLERAVAQLEGSPEVGCGQSILVLNSDRRLLNTRGNVAHYLGFGFLGGYLQPHLGESEPRCQLSCASGAAMLVRVAAVRNDALFEESFFMYLEDTDLSWAVRLGGFEIESVPGSVVIHKYVFKDDFRHYYHLEKNRLWLLLTYYRKRTLLLLLPAVLLMELGQLGFALSRGQLGGKLRSYRYLLRPDTRRAIARRRTELQQLRAISDQQFLEGLSGQIETPQLSGWLVRFVASPIFEAYFWLARKIVWW
jgi:GT2 family glycosyltransferase